MHLEVEGSKGRGRPCKTWLETIDNDLRIWNIDSNKTEDRPAWKNLLKTAVKSLTCENRGMVAQNR